MPSEKDLFANFERMRREMDELFGSALERSGLTVRGRRGFSPPVDVYYCGHPPRAVVKAELGGIDISAVALEIQGRTLTISGHRAPSEAENRVYQQLEIEHGAFRRIVELGADVRGDEAKATYEDGILRVELPLADPDKHARQVPIQTAEGNGDS